MKLLFLWAKKVNYQPIHMIQSNFSGRMLYDTCYFWQSEFLKFQHVFPSNEISKFCVILGTAGFYDIVTNKNVLSQLRWLGIPNLVSLEASVKYTAFFWADCQKKFFLIYKCFLSFYELCKIFKVYAYFACLETLDITIIKSSPIKNNQVTFNANEMGFFLFVCFARAQLDFYVKMRN